MVSIAQTGHRRAAARYAAAADQPPLSFGVLYPRNAIVAVIEDNHEARLAACALLDAGIRGDQIGVLSGRYFDTMITAARRRRSFICRLGACLSRLFSDDADYERSLLDEARQGHTLLFVHDVDPRIAERIRGVLRVHDAHDMRYYRPGSIEDLV